MSITTIPIQLRCWVARGVEIHLLGPTSVRLMRGVEVNKGINMRVCLGLLDLWREMDRPSLLQFVPQSSIPHSSSSVVSSVKKKLHMPLEEVHHLAFTRDNYKSLCERERTDKLDTGGRRRTFTKTDTLSDDITGNIARDRPNFVTTINAKHKVTLSKGGSERRRSRGVKQIEQRIRPYE
ncbi:hypothetical protein J6590_033852 [Homalodisca vitripennis]|nr:hypothetical protein J6590_033852 [Homalodisca vitripennis]